MARRRSELVNCHWSGFVNSFSAFGAGTVAATVQAAQHDRETLMRTRGELLAFADGSQAPGGVIDVGVGMVLVPEGTGTTVLWSPITDADVPWFWYERFTLAYEEFVTDVIDAVGAPVFRKTIDSKAMRRIRNQEVQIVAENATIGVGMSIVITANGRQLTQE